MRVPIVDAGLGQVPTPSGGIMPRLAQVPRPRFRGLAQRRGGLAQAWQHHPFEPGRLAQAWARIIIRSC